jgi:uncharacterized protein YbjT (DUF2867 family)
MKILVTGVTGYVGARLVPSLLDAGHQVVCLTRNPSLLENRPWSKSVKIVRGDVLEASTLGEAVSGVEAAYYLVHSMSSSHGFEDEDRRAAANFRTACEQAHVGRILYLGGLGDDAPDLSRHLRSRAEVGRILAAGSIPVTTLRAAIILGSGSASFEMMRHLVEKLPVMVTPRWVHTQCQPIGIRDVLHYLVGCLTCEATVGQTFDIGGTTVATYLDLMKSLARLMGLSRWILPVPIISPRFSSYWVNLITPVPYSLARALVESLRHEVVCHEDRIRQMIPGPVQSFEEAVELALTRIERRQVVSRWSDASWRGKATPGRTLLQTDEGFIKEIQVREVRLPPDVLFGPVRRIGGQVGYYCMDWAWKARGMIDRFLGGVGLRRGRRDPEELRTGDALDFWRVADYAPSRRLLLFAEMKVPGRAWLEFRCESVSGEFSRITQIAHFRPRGLGGYLYWYVLYPFHALIFRGMIDGIVRCAEAEAARAGGTSHGE